MKVLLDMNLSPRWADSLNEAGFETVHWSSLGAANASDSEIMDFAKARDYDGALITVDLQHARLRLLPLHS
ncbi:MAG: DUF5615 family PIN-like protein [Candidatus Adiutrix sp.]|jgi:predicted nuclease of predicted toxin-antitoxin system|nr:DUF5615 family PIN-like protein [Candidatus Adiutrix sp.]